MAPWVWFTIAVLTAVAGGLLLAADYGRRTAHSRERRRWAALRSWQFVESDPVLPGRWRHGVIAQGGPGTAGDLVAGRLFTAQGRRSVKVFDHHQGGRVSAVLVAVQRAEPVVDVVIELWLPSVPFPQDAGLELLGPVGERYAFVTDLATARPMITPELGNICDDIGQDIPVAWLEQDWVLAAAPASSTPARLERLLRVLGELADQLENQPGGDGPGDGDTPVKDDDTPDRTSSY
ncbi:MAG: hypothetical protein ACRDT0_20690 [Pseudonocardiaceae bacterium]